MAIWHVNIDLGGETYCAHLENEDELLFQVPIKNDGSDNWGRLQAWLDDGNQIVDDMSNKDVWYIEQRKSEYPPLEESTKLASTLTSLGTGTLLSMGRCR